MRALFAGWVVVEDDDVGDGAVEDVVLGAELVGDGEGLVEEHDVSAKTVAATATAVRRM